MRPRWHAAIVHENVSAMSGTDTTTLWERVHERVRESDRAIPANDGVIATAGLLEGFSGAGAGDQLLLLVATAATIAGGLSAGGAKWAEVAAPRESELDLVDEEVARIASQPEVEQAGLAAYWQECGLTPELAREVAARLTAKNALAAQLDADHGLEEITSPRAAWLSGLETMLAFMAGAAIPLLMTFLAPVDIEIWAIVGAVMLSLVLTSLLAARLGRVSGLKMLARSLAVGFITMGVSYLVGRAFI